MHVEKRNLYKIFVGKPEGKKALRRKRRRWKDNVRVALEWEDIDWIRLAQEETSEHGNETLGPIKYCEILEQLSD
jgi:hypothetical protein